MYASKRVGRVRISSLWYYIHMYILYTNVSTLSIYPSEHNQLIRTIRTLFEAYIVAHVPPLDIINNEIQCPKYSETFWGCPY